MLKIVLPLLLLGLSGANKPVPNSVSSLQTYLNGWVKDPVLQNAGISVYVYDLNRNIVLAEENAEMCLVPASTMKLVTTGSALEVLGAGYRFKTRIEYTGDIDSNGVLHGNVFITGGADPSLGSGYYSNYNADFLEQWVNAIKEAGIDSVNGRIIGDAGLLGINPTPAHWSWGDIGNYYGAPASGLTIFDNKTTISFKSGSNAGDSTWIVAMNPYIPELKIFNQVKAANSSADNAYIYGGLYDPNRIAEGSIPKGRSSFDVKISIHDPAYVAAYYLDSVLRMVGINTSTECTTQRRLLFESSRIDTLKRKTIHNLHGASIGHLTYLTNQHSVNLFAEHLFAGVGMRYYADGSVFSSSKAVQSYWRKKGINTVGLEMADGCGLSRANAISAKHLALILKHMNASNNAETFRKSLAIAGQTGTLRTIGKNTVIAGNLIGKSGSMNRVRSYAGYVNSATNDPLVFAIIVNNYTCTGYQMKERIEKLMVAMGNYKRES